jgi:hypothetical protein
MKWSRLGRPKVDGGRYDGTMEQERKLPIKSSGYKLVVRPAARIAMIIMVPVAVATPLCLFRLGYSMVNNVLNTIVIVSVFLVFFWCCNKSRRQDLLTAFDWKQYRGPVALASLVFSIVSLLSMNHSH